MRTLALAGWFVAGMVFGIAPLRAGDLKFPSSGGGVMLTMPDDWKTSEGRDGSMRCTSADGEFSFELLPGRVVDNVDLATAAAGIADASGLTDVRIDDGGEKVNGNGVTITGRIVHGMKKDVEYVGVVSIFAPEGGERCAFQCFGTKTVLLVHSKEMARITASVRPAK